MESKQNHPTSMLRDLSLGGQQRSRGGSDVTGSEISAQDRKDLKSSNINYDAMKMIGHGSFGAVFMAKNTETDEIVAIKKVLQDKRFKNRELQVMKQIAKTPHPYVVTLHHHFVSKGGKVDEVYLNLVLEYVPETVYSVTKYYNQLRESVPILSVKLYLFQLCRALAHIHGMDICHRDIKPQNLLVDPVRQVLKLCDFGSAKVLVHGEPNIAYICSRYYRAPELIIGASEYSTAIDVWSAGCVLAELLTGSPLFVGGSGVDQIIEVIKILGTPSREDMKKMNPSCSNFVVPQMRQTPWSSIFKPTVNADAIDLVSKLLVYVPETRLRAIDACSNSFFCDLQNPETLLADGNPLPAELFEYTREEQVHATMPVPTKSS